MNVPWLFLFSPLWGILFGSFGVGRETWILFVAYSFTGFFKDPLSYVKVGYRWICCRIL